MDGFVFGDKPRALSAHRDDDDFHAARDVVACFGDDVGVGRQFAAAHFLEFVDVGFDHVRQDVGIHGFHQRFAAAVHDDVFEFAAVFGDDAGVEVFVNAGGQAAAHHQDARGADVLVDVVPQLLLVFFWNEEAGGVDVGGFAVAAIDDFDAGAGFAGDADAVVDDAVLFEGADEAFFVIRAHEAGGAGADAGVGEVDGDRQSFAADGDVHGLRAVDGVALPAIDVDGHVYGGVRGDGDDFHWFSFFV